MRVLLVTGCYPPDQCGVGDYAEKLASALSVVEDVKVGVLTTLVHGRNNKSASSVELIDAVHQWTFYELPKLILTIRRWKPDLVHIQYPSQGYTHPGLISLLPFVCRLFGIKVVQTWHEPHGQSKKHRVKSLLYFSALKLGAKGLIFVRPNYISLLPAPYGQMIKHIPQVIIPNASPLPASELDETLRMLLRKEHLGTYQRLIVFFGFVYPSKGVDLLFDIATSSRDSLVIAGAVKDDSYMQHLVNAAQAKGWRDDQLHFTGFLSPQDAADLLSVADAVVLPFLDGGGEWNTSIHSALAQGTLVITTSLSPHGDEPTLNLYTAAPMDIVDMRGALDRLAGRRTPPISSESQWVDIANAHLAFYQQFVNPVVSNQA